MRISKLCKLGALLFLGTFINSSGFGETPSDLKAFENIKGSLDIHCAPAHSKLMQNASEKIVMFNNSIKITLIKTPVSKIFNSAELLKNGQINILTSEFELNEKKYSLKAYPFAIDGTAIIINKDNPLWNLTIKQIQKIFSGKVLTWQELGGSPYKVNIYTMEKKSQERTLFELLMLGGTKISKNAIETSSFNGMKTLIEADKYGIGYISLSQMDRLKVKAVKIDGRAPTLRNAILGRYKYFRKSYMYASDSPSSLTTKFIDFILSKEGREMIRKNNLIPLAR
jgi:phosphate transport system substrate-binding protein